MGGHDICLTLEGPVAVFEKREVIEALADDMMEHLLACGMLDPSISEAYSENEEFVTLEFSMAVEEQDPAAAVSKAMSAIRSAFHTANVSTPGWEAMISHMRHTVSASSDGDLLPA